MVLFGIHRLGGIRAVANMRSEQMRAALPDVGSPVTLVLTDVKGSTELWEWDTQLAAQVTGETHQSGFKDRTCLTCTKDGCCFGHRACAMLNSTLVA